MTWKRSSTRSVTIGDVAVAAEVAPMTVSRYLNQHPNISEKTARKIAAAITRLGYTPNVAARILMGQPSNTIGLIVPTLADNFFSAVAHRVQAIARERDKLVWVASSDCDTEIEFSLIEKMKQHHVDGILLVPLAAKLKRSRIAESLPIVVMDRPLEDNCDAILVDNRGGMAKLAQHFVSHGYKRLLCLSTDAQSVYTTGERIAGYEDVMRKHGLAIKSHTMLKDRSELTLQVCQALQSRFPPQAILCTNNLTTINLLQTLFEKGVSIPRDVAVGGFDDFELASLTRPGITVIRQPVAELGAQGAQRLFEWLASSESAHHSVTTTLPTQLIVRGSCGCRQKKQTDER